MPPHFLPEDLLAYHQGQLSPEENEKVREHLVLCDRCSALVLDLASFPEIEPLGSAGEAPEDAVFVRRWESLRARLQGEGDLRPTPPQERGKPLRRIFFLLPSVPGALAAGLAVVSLGLAFWTFSLHQRLTDLSQPAVRVAVSSLVPRETAAARDGERAEHTSLPAWTDRILLILNLFEPRTYSAYQVQIFNALEGGKEIWSSRDLRRASDGNFAVEVPRSLLSGGAYRIELSGLAGGRRDRLAVYNLLLDFDSFRPE
ncbi:MAG TPA: zf-HC2 domain-containing protein [Thermoanaerobaculia bacterium]|nr:zf-HC2 domain-containing protein [Thermoanaerobaculia bacterium]